LEKVGVAKDDIFETRFLGNIVIVADPLHTLGGAGTNNTRMFFAFDNEIDLTFVFVAFAVVFFFVCFTNFKFTRNVNKK